MKIINQILFQPTFACNLRCRYCYLGDKRKKASQEDFSGIVIAAKELAEKIKKAEYQISNILFHGAEPTMLPPEILAEVCNVFLPILTEKTGFFSIQTNGTLLTPEYMTAVEEKIHSAARLRFSISVDGPRDITDKNRGRGTYDKVMKNICFLKKRRYFVGLFGVFTSEMLSMMAEMDGWIRLLENQNIPWKFQLASSPNHLSDEEQVRLAHWLHDRNWHRLYNGLNVNMCAWEGNECRVLHFNASGEFPPCDRSTGTRYESILNWKKLPFDKAILKREHAFSEMPVAKKCSYCPIRKICNSGCPVFRVNGVSHECMLRRTILQLVAKQMGVPIQKTFGLFRGAINSYANQGDIPSVGEILGNV